MNPALLPILLTAPQASAGPHVVTWISPPAGATLYLGLAPFALVGTVEDAGGNPVTPVWIQRSIDGEPAVANLGPGSPRPWAPAAPGEYVIRLTGVSIEEFEDRTFTVVDGLPEGDAAGRASMDLSIGLGL